MENANKAETDAERKGDKKAKYFTATHKGTALITVLPEQVQSLLQETSDSIKRTQYFDILTYCWEQMSRNREERVLLIRDEAYDFLSESIKQYGQALLDIPCYKLLMGELELGKLRTMSKQYRDLLNFR